jgi:hypothetical protein
MRNCSLYGRLPDLGYVAGTAWSAKDHAAVVTEDSPMQTYQASHEVRGH